MFHRAVEGIVIFDKQGCFIDANHSFARASKLKIRALKLKLSQFVSPENKGRLDKSGTLFQKREGKGELPVRLRSGEDRLFELTITSNILNGFYMSIMRDITESAQWKTAV
ncbi:hypothetical protein PO124_32760 [Bacillus licheniformis]|nr:hypothetical protein [Bacillus licheniformis]